MDNRRLPAAAVPNPLDSYEVTIDRAWLGSRNDLKLGLNTLKQDVDRFENKHSEDRIHSLKTVVASKLIEKLNEIYPDNTLHAFEQQSPAQVAAALIKQKLLEVALEHPLFKARHWVAVHDAVNSTVHYISNFFMPTSDMPPVRPVMPTGCQSVLLNELRTLKHKYLAFSFKEHDGQAAAAPMPVASSSSSSPRP